MSKYHRASSLPRLPGMVIAECEYLAHDVPHVGIIHWVALDRSCVTVEDVHEVPFLAVLEHQIQLVHLNVGCRAQGNDIIFEEDWLEERHGSESTGI